MYNLLALLKFRTVSGARTSCPINVVYVKFHVLYVCPNLCIYNCFAVYFFQDQVWLILVDVSMEFVCL